jgi:4-diphosphocytidyl-2-C-methyl-D-erythritol kinase
MTVEELGDGAESVIEIEGAELPSENTLTKTLRMAAELARFPAVRVKLVKRIPMQAGLGGGSTDAAGLLRILRKMAPSTVPDREFLAVAEAVGADVPFFLTGGRALGARFGDVITPLPDETPLWRLIVQPNCGASTPAMYGALDEARGEGRTEPLTGPLPMWAIENDFHLVAPEESLDLLRRAADFKLTSGGLCGSGSCVFFSSAEPARLEAVRPRFDGLQTWLVKDLSRAESIAVA